MIRNDLILFREWMRNSRSIMQPYWSYMILNKQTYAIWHIPCIDIVENSCPQLRVRPDFKVHVKLNMINASIEIRDSSYFENTRSEISIANPDIHKQLAYSINKIGHNSLKYYCSKIQSTKNIGINVILRNLEEYNANFKW